MGGHARIFAICGGIPAYLHAFKQDRSVEQNIVATLSTSSFGRSSGI